jgi:ferredoxin-NADP reductase
MAVLPWLFPQPVALGGFLLVHVIWFATCERAFPPPEPVPPGWTETKVIATIDQTADIRTFRIRRPKGFDFKPGQFLPVRIPVDGKPLIRCYSICSAPASKSILEISVKRQGVVSGEIHRSLRRGTPLLVRRPGGPFVYPEDDTRPIVLLGGGVGVTPLLSMMRHAVTAEPQRRVAFVLSVRSPEEIPFREELLEFPERHRQTTVIIAVTRGTAGRGFHSGRVDGEVIRRVAGDPKKPVYLICGPEPMIEGMKKLLASLGVPEKQVRSEAFEAAVASATAPLGSKTPVKLVLAKTRQTVRIPPGQSILEAAEGAGAEIPFACRAGVCQTCRTKLVSGEVDSEAPALTGRDRDAGYIYPCAAWAKVDCVIEA